MALEGTRRSRCRPKKYLRRGDKTRHDVVFRLLRT